MKNSYKIANIFKRKLANMTLESKDWDVLWSEYIGALRVGDESLADNIALNILSWHERQGLPAPVGIVKRLARLEELYRIVMELTSDVTGLAFIPDVVTKGVETGIGTIFEVKNILIRLAHAERLELRPESGLGRLSNAERAKCPIMSDGTPLSWARIL